MVEVKLNKSNNNPFYGLRACLTLFQNVGNNITEVMLENAYKEVKGNKELRQMFYSLLFSIGDSTISSRAKEIVVAMQTEKDSL